MKKIIIVSAILILISGCTVHQSPTAVADPMKMKISGTVMTMSTCVGTPDVYAPRANAHIVVYQGGVEKYHAVTDVNGRYFFNDIPAGDYEVVGIIPEQYISDPQPVSLIDEEGIVDMNIQTGGGCDLQYIIGFTNPMTEAELLSFLADNGITYKKYYNTLYKDPGTDLYSSYHFTVCEYERSNPVEEYFLSLPEVDRIIANYMMMCFPKSGL